LAISFFLSQPKTANGMEFPVGEIGLPTVYPLQAEMKLIIKIKPTNTNCWCVPWVKAQLGITESMGDAKDWKPNTQIPTIGAVVITRESSLGHVGLVTDYDPAQGIITISEKNFVHCTVTHGRKLSVNNPTIVGYWVKNL